MRHGVKLKLTAPATSLDTGDSWLGGNPRLPDPFEWPHVEGKPLHFLGQIDCSALPAEIWGGLGPDRVPACGVADGGDRRFPGRAGIGQAAATGRLTSGSSLNGVIVSSVM
ncbi:DUF1963 domain-containing protein [Rhodoblastus acidophilus]|uniref:DUF1963 domain-containing protein n=1 Tax=Rhodoblastus acidophilus TaxID=1074 RepID=UPI003CC89EB0